MGLKEYSPQRGYDGTMIQVVPLTTHSTPVVFIAREEGGA
jgi:hypothetical protein